MYEADNPFESETINYAAFGEANLDVIPDRLTLTAGLRYDYETVETETALQAQVSAPNSPLDPTTTEMLLGVIRSRLDQAPTNPNDAYDAFLPKVGATVDLTPDLSLGATVQRGYRSGGVQVLSTGEVDTFDPEFTWNYEASLRSRWLDGRLVANANAFYTDWRDQQVRVPIEGTSLTRTVNAGASTLYGAELELRVVPVSNLTVFGSGGLVHTEFDTFVLGGRDLAGFEFPNAAGETFALGATYDPQTGPFGAVSVSYTGPYFSSVNTLPEGGNDPRLRGGDYTVVNARVGYAATVQGTRVRASLFSRNLFDEDVTLQRNFDPVGDLVARMGDPRVVGLTLEVNL